MLVPLVIIQNRVISPFGLRTLVHFGTFCLDLWLSFDQWSAFFANGFISAFWTVGYAILVGTTNSYIQRCWIGTGRGYFRPKIRHWKHVWTNSSASGNTCSMFLSRVSYDTNVIHNGWNCIVGLQKRYISFLKLYREYCSSWVETRKPWTNS